MRKVDDAVKVLKVYKLRKVDSQVFRIIRLLRQVNLDDLTSLASPRRPPKRFVGIHVSNYKHYGPWLRTSVSSSWSSLLSGGRHILLLEVIL